MRRGPYFRYLFDKNVPVPEATLRRWNKEDNDQNNGNGNNHVPPVEINAAPEAIQENLDGQDSASESGRSSPLSEMDFSISSGRSSSPLSNVQDASESGRSSPLGEMDFSISSRRSSSPLSNVQDTSISSDFEDDYDSVASDVNNDSDADNDHNSVGGNSMADSDAGSLISNDGEVAYDSDDDNFHQNPRHVLYPGCRITLEESRLLIMSFALRFGLSDVAIENLLKVINCHLPEDEYDSFHVFKQHMPAPPLVEEQYLCPQDHCQLLVQFGDGVNNVQCECGFWCDKKTLKKDGSYFLKLALKDQIESLLQNREVNEALRWESENESDVIGGRVYQAGVNQGLIKKNCDISLQFNTDGIQLFGSSTIQTWPIQVAINELPFRIRNQNIILCALWYGQGKPNMNSFLLPFVRELNDLHENGILLPTNPPRLVKVHTLVCSVDSMASAPLQNLKTFRGRYGCPLCLHPGVVHLDGIRGGSTRLYQGGLHELRTRRQHFEDVNAVIEQLGRPGSGRNRTIRGIKGPSVLMRLHLFHIVDSFVPDYLHCVLLGVVKTMFTWWTLGRNSDERFYFGSPAKLDAVDAVLLSIKPPSEITKTPQTVHKSKLWKGHEWRNFLLYYSLPCLKAINFPGPMLKHWFLLVCSMFCFLSDNVTAEKSEKGKAALTKFVVTLEEVYGTPELMKFDIHLLLHIPRSVKNFGALWACSTFPFEHYNGSLAKMFRSSQAVPLQICKNYVRLQGLKEKGNIIAQDNRVPYCMKQALQSLVCGKTSKHAVRVDRDLVLIGASRFGALMLVQLNLVENLVNAPVNNTNVQFYTKFIYKNVKHHVHDCPALQKRMNCVVKLVTNDFISISHVVKIRTIEQVPRSFVVILGFKLVPTNDTLIEDRQLGLSSNLFMNVVEKSNECVAIFPRSIVRKCLLTFYPGDPLKFCCYPLVNLVERD